MLYLTAILVMIPLVISICCEKNKDCIIAETCQDASCGNCSITVYNRTGTITIPQNEMIMENYYLYTYNASKNLSKYDTYPYAINCTNDKICKGDCQVEIKQQCGEEGRMEIAIMIFISIVLIGFIASAFYFKHPALKLLFGYIALGLMIAGINTTRLIAESYGADTGIVNMINTIYKPLIWVTWILISAGFVYGLFRLFWYIKENADRKRKKVEY